MSLRSALGFAGLPGPGLLCAGGWGPRERRRRRPRPGSALGDPQRRRPRLPKSLRPTEGACPPRSTRRGPLSRPQVLPLTPYLSPQTGCHCIGLSVGNSFTAPFPASTHAAFPSLIYEDLLNSHSRRSAHKPESLPRTLVSVSGAFAPRMQITVEGGPRASMA